MGWVKGEMGGYRVNKTRGKMEKKKCGRDDEEWLKE